MKKLLLMLSLLLLIIGAFYFYYPSRSELPTYFNYTENELKPLRKLNSEYTMSSASLKKWDVVMFELIKNNKLGDAYASRIYAYVYIAQRDAAYLSYNLKDDYFGTLDPVSANVLCAFFSSDCVRIKELVLSDPYSEKLSQVILNKMRLRMEQDKKQEYLAAEIVDSRHWQGIRPYFGQETGSWKTWTISSPKSFLPQKPPLPDAKQWQTELNQTELALKNITPEQTKAVVFWAGNPSTVTPPGIWLKFANDYMEDEQVSFTRQLFIRSVLAIGIADAVIGVFYAKYSFWIKRPFMLNHSIHTVMPTPNHPSYPAGHAAISSVAATILSYYLPENQKKWWADAEEASSTRIWGGIHFPIDARVGWQLGKSIGDAVIRAQPKLKME